MAKKVETSNSNQISMFDFIEFALSDYPVIDAIVLMVDTTSKKTKVMEVPIEIYLLKDQEIINEN